MTKPISLRGDDTRVHRDRANAAWERNRQPERLAEVALLTLNPDRAGRGTERSWAVEPDLAASEAERVAHVEKFEKLAVQTFGIDAITAAAKPGDFCRWCWAGRDARVHDRPEPATLVASQQVGQRDRFRQALVHLIGEPCSRCAGQLDLAGQTPQQLRQIMVRLAARVHPASATRSTRAVTASGRIQWTPAYRERLAARDRELRRGDTVDYATQMAKLAYQRQRRRGR